jgi:ATP/maltotriose-dependent transcriptional regulator MalT
MRWSGGQKARLKIRIDNHRYGLILKKRCVYARSTLFSKLMKKPPDAENKLKHILDESEPIKLEEASAAMRDPLTEREMEVLRLVGQGLSNREIGDQLYISTGTVKIHLHNIYRKLIVKNRALAIARARELKIIQQRTDNS